MKFILGKKIGMTQIFNKDNQVAPVTVVSAGPVFITQIKTQDKDGYQAIQIGYEKKKKIAKEKNKNKKFLYRYFREYRIQTKDLPEKMKAGDSLDVSQFNAGDKVKISSINKGKGFQGAVKRWGFSGGPATHGHRHNQRGLGSVGCRYPQRVLKGKKMAGRMGAQRVTLKNLKVAQILQEENIILVNGSVAGVKGGLVEIRG